MLLPVAGSCLVMIVAQSAATSRAYATRHHQQLDENADLVGLSAVNTAAAFSGTFVVNGSPTQTAMVESSGGTNQLAHLATAGVVALVFLFLTDETRSDSEHHCAKNTMRKKLQRTSDGTLS